MLVMKVWTGVGYIIDLKGRSRSFKGLPPILREHALLAVVLQAHETAHGD